MTEDLPSVRDLGLTNCLARASILVLLAFVALTSAIPILEVALAQSNGSSGIETATPDRLDESAWWPTKSTVPRESFAGQASCKKCHVQESTTQPFTPMGMAGRRAGESQILIDHPTLSLSRSPHTFSINTGAVGVNYSVSDGAHTVIQPIQWAFGSGEYGQTFLYEKDNRWYESEVSFYKNLGALDLTTGHEAKPDQSVEESLGKLMQPGDAQHCFQCHTTFASNSGQFDPQHAVGGLDCEACHGPARAHVTAMNDLLNQAGPAKDAKALPPDARLMNPALLSPVDSVDFCGACHRTWADIAFSTQPKPGLYAVRFQPYRLEESKCWGRNGDARITCIACHNPHKPLERDLSVYDHQCLTCHVLKNETTRAKPQLPGKACPVSTTRCTTCHMPKYNVASMHGEFTDHWIRVVHPGSAFSE